MIAAEGADVGVRELARRSASARPSCSAWSARWRAAATSRRTARPRAIAWAIASLALGASGEGAFDYVVAARRELERLAHEHHLNGFVSVLRDGRAIYLLAVQADGPVAIKVSPGSEMPLHSTSAGKVLLAALRRCRGAQAPGPRKLAAITPHTVTDPAALVASLAKVRRQGFAHRQRGEHSGRAVGRRADPRSQRRRAWRR